ncbi:MAG TPA: hypothetical protein VF062_18020 [Candidatus Limnocylindrales bacterium]
MENFQNRLLSALTEIAAQQETTAVDEDRRRPVAARPRWVWPSLAGVAATVAAAAVAVSGMSGMALPQNHGGAGPGAQPAPVVENVGFTLRLNADGSVDFTATELVDPAAATAALNKAGIAGRVVVHRDACAPVDWDDVAVVQPRPKSTTDPGRPGIIGDETATLHASNYPQGGGLLVVIVVRHYPQGVWAHVSWLGYKDVNKIPTCVQLFDPGTGADPNTPG